MRSYSGFKIAFEVPWSLSNSCGDSVINSCEQNIERINNLPSSVKECVLAEICSTMPGENAIVRNSDNSYNQSVAGGDTLILADQTINVYLDGVLNSSTVYPAMTNPDVNLIWN